MKHNIYYGALDIMQPLKFNPIFSERIWGSDRLRQLFNKPLPTGKRIGESWELVELPGACCTVSGGPWDGWTLRKLLDQHGQKLGFLDHECRHPFGLLIKFLDANDVLSVQVHPDLEACAKLPGSSLKTECWYIMDAEPGAVLYIGFNDGVTPDDLQRAIADGTVEKLLNVVPVKKGDFYFLPAGTVHAIGAGILITEIQTPSDTTFRLFDWNRVDADGKARELHIEESLISVHYPVNPPIDYSEYSDSSNIAHQNLNAVAKSMGRHRSLADCPYFSVAHVMLNREEIKLFPIPRPGVMICLNGSGQISNNSTDTDGCSFKAGDTLLLPKADNYALNIHQAGECLLTCLGPEIQA